MWRRHHSTDGDSTDSSEQGSTDSGIVIMSHLIEREQSIDDSDVNDDNDDNDVAMLPLDSGSVYATLPARTELRGIFDRIEIGMKKMTAAVQMFVFKYISWPIVYVRIPLLIVFAILLLASVITSSFLQPTHKAPQFLDSNSNIQKLLDLQNEVSQQSDYDCWNCSAYFVMQAAGGTLPTGSPPTGAATVLPHPSSSSSSNTHHNTGTATSSTTNIQPSSTTAGKTSSSGGGGTKISTTIHHIKPTTTTTTTSQSTHSTSSTRHTRPTQPTQSSTTTSSLHHKTTSGPTATPATLPPSKCSGDNYDNCIKNQADKPAFSGSAVVYVVFGITGITRTFSPSHVIAQENNLVSGIQVL